MDTLVYQWIFGGRPASAGQPMDTLAYWWVLILVDVRHLPDSRWIHLYIGEYLVDVRHLPDSRWIHLYISGY